MIEALVLAFLVIAPAATSSAAQVPGGDDARAAVPLGDTARSAAEPRLALWPVVGEITSPFGPRWGGFHTGLDIAVPMYTPVRAAASGVVSIAGQPNLVYGDTGEIVVIVHSKDFMTEYVHLDDKARPPIVHVGEHVTAGQVIAYVGLTGWTTGPHLHFMTIVNGREVDPLRYLPPR